MVTKKNIDICLILIKVDYKDLINLAMVLSGSPIISWYWQYRFTIMAEDIINKGWVLII
jgi:hypothetical protein